MSSRVSLVSGTILHTTKSGKIEVISYNGYKEVTVKFLNTGNVRVARADHVRDGKVLDTETPPAVYVHGYGINDSEDLVHWTLEPREYLPSGVSKRGQCRFYVRWENMLERCYCPKYHKLFPTYKDCYVCDDWLLFSNFKSWMKEQVWDNCHLDKDILVKGNKVYSPHTCVFVHHKVNTFLNDNKASRGDTLLGTQFLPEIDKFRSRCMNPFTGKSDDLGCHHSEDMAHALYNKHKFFLAKKIALCQKKT
jgi:hypothetical protein